jgi:thymidylate kinase
MNSVFIVIEGLDGVGKSSVAAALAEKMTREGMPSTAIRCPTGDYRLSEPYIRRMCDTDARYLFYLSGAKHTSDVVSSLLIDGSVISDRYYYSTLAYHRASGLRVSVDHESLDLLVPDFKYWLTVKDEQVRQERIKNRAEINPADTVVRAPGGLIERIELEFQAFGLTEIDTTGINLAEVVQLLWEDISGGRKC